MSEQKLMKDALGTAAVARLGSVLQQVAGDFPRDRFEQAVISGLEPLELKQRVHHIIDQLECFLPQPYEQAVAVLMAIPEQWDFQPDEECPHRFEAWPLIDYVGVHGLEHPELSLQALEKLTHLFSAEFAIRPFILQHGDITYHWLERWCSHDDHHVRRLASEGTRTRLPWGSRLPVYIDDPKPVISLLNRLRDDSSDYVRRSVANNLNDISKDHPELVLNTCSRWLKKPGQHTTRTVRHALRTLIKAGRPEVFPLLGHTAEPRIGISEFKLMPKTIRVGNELEFQFRLGSEGDVSQSLVVDYAIHFVKANGKQSAKVFKLKSLQLEPGESVSLNKKHSFALRTTRRFYPGTHQLAIHINGRELAQKNFRLEMSG